MVLCPAREVLDSKYDETEVSSGVLLKACSKIVISYMQHPTKHIQYAGINTYKLSLKKGVVYMAFF